MLLPLIEIPLFSYHFLLILVLYIFFKSKLVISVSTLRSSNYVQGILNPTFVGLCRPDQIVCVECRDSLFQEWPITWGIYGDIWRFKL